MVAALNASERIQRIVALPERNDAKKSPLPENAWRCSLKLCVAKGQAKQDDESGKQKPNQCGESGNANSPEKATQSKCDDHADKLKSDTPSVTKSDE